MISGGIIYLGIALIIAGILLLIIGSFLEVASKSNTNTNVAVGGFIGPFPFGFFTDKNMFWIWLAVFIVFVVLWFLLRRFL